MFLGDFLAAAGWNYGTIAGKLGEKTVPLGGILLAAGALLISTAGNVFILSAGCLIACSSISMVMPCCMGAASRLPGHETLSSAMILSSSNVGVFVMPLLTSGTAAITGSDLLPFRGGRCYCCRSSGHNRAAATKSWLSERVWAKRLDERSLGALIVKMA